MHVTYRILWRPFVTKNDLKVMSEVFLLLTTQKTANTVSFAHRFVAIYIH